MLTYNHNEMGKVMVNNSTANQQKIVEAARKIIVTKGMENLTIREIANELEMTDGALYRHFKSKKEIISLLIDDIERTLLATVEAAAKKSDKPLNKLKNIFLSHISYSEQRRGVSFIIINETLSLKDKSLQRKMLNVIGKYLEKIRQILKEGVSAGSFRRNIDIASSSIVFFGMIQAQVMLWAISGYQYSFKKMSIEQIFDIFENGIMLL